MAVEFAYFSTEDDAQAANQVKMARILEFTHSIRTPFVIAAEFNTEPDQLWETGWVQSLGQKANICTLAQQVVGESLTLLSSQVLCNLSGGKFHLSSVSSCKPLFGMCLHFTATPTQVRVRQACFPKNFAFPKTVDQVVFARKRMKSKTKPEETHQERERERERSSLSARPNTGILLCLVDARRKLVPRNVISQSIGFTATRTLAYALGQRFQDFMQTAEECLAEAHGHAEHECAQYRGRSASVRFRLRTVVSARRYLATRQCHNKHANCWETITARIADLIKLCQRGQEGDSVSAQWFQDVRSALTREVQVGLEEAMVNSPAEDGWTTEQWRQILLDPQQFDLEDLEEVRVNAMQRAKACAKKA